MKPLERVFTVQQTVELLGGEEIVTPHWIKQAARRHGIGTLIKRRLVFTESQVQALLDAQALDAQQGSKPRPAPKSTIRKPKAAKPQPIPAPAANVTPLQARPERARSFGRPA
ncbi:hypothetical protein [Nonomuraea pusilla]|uniref:Uncharacterized protein n=1 Tax=Nonomuraea pusilla TaxID=46177 RepID=A0A1H7YU49_9ACTN|nr:hypothetical protein [Nonomuraea pusilla]SEM49742.1 hypothetical protein SAMN05660976_05278 [Nonomuraea pusilla]